MDESNSTASTTPNTAAFRSVPRTGVIFVMNEARKCGYLPQDDGWANLGQGQPETDELTGAPERVTNIDIEAPDFEYAPVPGLMALREAVATHYNTLYRTHKDSKYTAENVCISSGGRAALTRAAAALGEINLGHFLPDYTAYEELLGIFRLFSPIPILLDPTKGYEFGVDELENEITGRGLSAVLLSNPCNPTGKLVTGDEMAAWVKLGRQLDCALLVDEFYSHYVWSEEDEASPCRSAAEHIDDVNTDPVIIFDGLTKNWRYPGWRVAWTLGPKSVIEAISSAGSFLDGGGSRPLQRAAIPLLSMDHTLAETRAIQTVFRRKRALMLHALVKMGINIDRSPDGTFYVWGDVRALPDGINTGMSFFQTALQHQVICVPGVFFDVNPGRRRAQRPSRFRHHVRFSFGPDINVIEAGLNRLAAMIKTYQVDSPTPPT